MYIKVADLTSKLGEAAIAMLPVVRGNHSSNITCLIQVFFKRGE